MSPSNRCPHCAAIRPPNASFCPGCGAAYGSPSAPIAMPPRRTEIDLSFLSGLRFGAGLAVGVSIVALAFWVVAALLLIIGLTLPAAWT